MSCRRWFDGSSISSVEREGWIDTDMQVDEGREKQRQSSTDLADRIASRNKQENRIKYSLQ